MKFKGTAALLLLFVALGGYVYWTDIRGSDEREQAERDAVRVLAVDADEISSIRLTYPGTTFGARRTETAWEFLDNPGLEADAAEWNTLAGNVGRVEFDESVGEVTGGLEAFGLAEPRVRVDVELFDQTRESILFGGENPGGNFHYVKRASDEEILLAATSWSGLFEKDLAAMRDKTILDFDQDAVTGIGISGASSLVLAGGDPQWRIAEPIDWPADQSRVSTLLGTIAFARAVGFADEATDAEAGFDLPSWRVVLDAGGGDTDARHELIIGRMEGASDTDDTVRYYARDTSRPATFLIDSELPDLLARPLIDWRDRRIATFDRDEVVRIDLDVAGADPIRLARADAASPWLLASGDPADAGLVSELIGAIEFEQATAILDNPGPAPGYGLDAPRVRIELSGSDGQVLLDGSLGSETPDSGAYWTTAEAGVVFEVSGDLRDAVSLSPGELGGSAAPVSPAP